MLQRQCGAMQLWASMLASQRDAPPVAGCLEKGAGTSAVVAPVAATTVHAVGVAATAVHVVGVAATVAGVAEVAGWQWSVRWAVPALVPAAIARGGDDSSCNGSALQKISTKEISSNSSCMCQLFKPFFLNPRANWNTFKKCLFRNWRLNALFEVHCTNYRIKGIVSPIHYIAIAIMRRGHGGKHKKGWGCYNSVAIMYMNRSWTE